MREFSDWILKQVQFESGSGEAIPNETRQMNLDHVTIQSSFQVKKSSLKKCNKLN